MKAAIREARSAFGETQDFFNHHNFEKAAEKLHVTKERVANLELAFSQEAEACAAAKELNESMRNFSLAFDAEMLKRRGDEALRETRSALTVARDDIGHFNWPKALTSLGVARDLIAQTCDTSDIMGLAAVATGMEAARTELR